MDAVVQAVELLLLSGKSVLLAGAPGTGKTRLGFETARGFTGVEPVVVVGRGDMVARELLYSYEPVDSGLRVVLGGLAVSVLASWARLMAGLAPRWLLLDELNRMNAETVLGSLFTALDLAHRLRVEVVSRWLTEKTLGDRRLLKIVASYARLDEGLTAKGLQDALKRATKAGLSGLPLPLSWRALATVNMVDRSHLFRLGFALLRRFPLVLVPGIGQTIKPELDSSELEKVIGEVKERTRTREAYRAALGQMEELCPEAVRELVVSSPVTGLDRPVYAVDLDESATVEALRRYSEVSRAVAVFTALLLEAGVEIGSALLADTCRLVAVALLRGADASLVADVAVASLLLPQLGSVAPALKAELLFRGGSRRAEKVASILSLAGRLLGEHSMSARYSEALGLELPLQRL